MEEYIKNYINGLFESDLLGDMKYLQNELKENGLITDNGIVSYKWKKNKNIELAICDNGECKNYEIEINVIKRQSVNADLDFLICEISTKYETMKQEFKDKIKENIDIDFSDDVANLYVIEGLLSFLKYEKENILCELPRKLDNTDYTILKLYKDLCGAFLGIYYNSDCGVSYNDTKNILKELVREYRENEVK